MFAYIARETEKAVGIVRPPLTGEMKPLWVPRSKIKACAELDLHSASVQLAGEQVRRLCVPVEIDVDVEFLQKVGA